MHRPEVSAAEDVSSFLEQVKRMPPAEKRAGERGRLIFAMDATMSRQPTWDRALQIQSEMFIETEKIGGLDVQLIYFRGFNECRASKWVSEPSALARMMTGVDCRGGNTQIGKVLEPYPPRGRAKAGSVPPSMSAMRWRRMSTVCARRRARSGFSTCRSSCSRKAMMA